MTSEPPNQNTSPDLVSRKSFLKQGLGIILTHLAETLPQFPATESTQQRFLRPPGAIPEADFLITCEPFCMACRNACPKEAIFHDQSGFPILQPHLSPCVMCTDVPCTKVCPTDALTPLETPRQIALGTAVIELTICTAYQGSGCHICYQTCPVPDEAIQMIEGLPQIVPESCTGCGVCVFECPTPEAIWIRPKTAV